MGGGDQILLLFKPGVIIPPAGMPVIRFYHSGGGANCNTNDDLGGDISSCAISFASLNNLFDDLSATESRDGLVDYRCIYVSNAGTTTARCVKVYIDSERQGGSFIDIGTIVANEIQKIELTGSHPPNEGEYMLLSVTGYTPSFIVFYSVNPTIWQGNFQTEMRGVDSFQDIIISEAGTIGFSTDFVFTISYIGQAESHDIPPIEVLSSTLDGQAINVSEYQQGSPVNTVAPTIPNTTTPPPGVTFWHPLRGNPLLIGDLRPGDQFPLWVRRTTPENTLNKIVDDFRLNIDATYP